MKKIIIILAVIATWLCVAQMNLEGQVSDNNETSIDNSPSTLFADLVGDHTAVSDLTLNPGDPFQLFYSVSNIGDATAGASDTKFYFSNDQTFGDGDDIYVSQETCGSLIEGATLNFTGNLVVPAGLSLGTWYLFFKVDANNSVPEASESNNVEMVMWAFTIGGTNPQITVLSPNGGENWQAGISYNIDWLYSNITGNVRIDLIQGTSTTPILIISSSTPIGSETYSWTIPGTISPASNYKIKITSLSNSTVNDISNSFFSIVPAPTLTVLYPNGGEVLLEEASYAITWTYLSLTGNLKIELMQGTSTTPVLTISPSLAVNTGTYDWLVPVSLSQASNYKIRIASLSNPSVNDYSNDYFTINPAPSITVSAPNGGEVWLMGGSYNITWSSVNLSGNVKVELLQGTNPSPIITINPSIAANAGTYSWSIPNALDSATNYKVKITSLSNAALYDYSNSYFTINPAPSLTILAPNGGENWLQGGAYSINWSYTSLSGNVKIELMQGTSATPILTVNPSTSAISGSYSWTIPVTVSPASNYRIKITSLSTGTVYDQSDSYFTVNPAASITLLSPNGGELWQVGNTYAITWTYLSFNGNVRLDLMQGTNSTPVLMLSPSLTIAAGSYDWLIPSSVSPASNYKIKITSLDNPALTDLSDEYFSINPVPSLTVTSPNGGNVWLKGTTQLINWTVINLTGNVVIELLQESVIVSTISNSIAANTGTCSWTIPNDLSVGSNYRVKITSLTTPTVNDQSDQPFTIAEQAINIQSPNGLEIWISGESYDILWSIENVSGNVKIELCQGPANVPIATIHSSISASVGTYLWVVPTLTTASDFKVKISSLTDPSVFDLSDAYFTIEGITANDDQVQTPMTNALTGTYPNPFNPSTTITYSIVTKTNVVIQIYNIRGQKVRHLFDGFQEPGAHSIVWNGLNDAKQGLPSGVYTVSLHAGTDRSSYKITLAK